MECVNEKTADDIKNVHNELEKLKSDVTLQQLKNMNKFKNLHNESESLDGELKVLHFAARKGHENIAKIVLEKGAQDPNTVLEGNSPALHIAAR